MAKYKITSLNYITAGKYRNFVNLDYDFDGDAKPKAMYHVLAADQKDQNDNTLEKDITLEHRIGSKQLINQFIAKETVGDVQQRALASPAASNKLVLNEQQSDMTDIDLTANNYPYIRVTDSCCTDEQISLYEDYVTKLNKTRFGHTYVVEKQQNDCKNNVVIDSNNNVITPMFDLDDVCVKSCNKIKNNVLMNFDLTYPTKSEDFYLPDNATAMSFCQCDDTTYILTKPTADDVTILHTSHELTREQEYVPTTYTTFLSNDQMKTYLYTPLRQLSSNSYASALSTYELTSDQSMFVPALTFNNVERNYIAAVRHTSDSQHSELKTDYDNGNIYAQIYYAKNTYDAKYQMNVTAQNKLENCRNYAGIRSCGNQLHLKFYDDTAYLGKTTVENGLSVVNSTKYQSYPSYQKIESFNPVQTNATTYHKSFFFSVDLTDVSLTENTTTTDEMTDKMNEVKSQIRRDLTNAIRDIAENVSPANTELFAVYFDGE